MNQLFHLAYCLRVVPKNIASSVLKNAVSLFAASKTQDSRNITQSIKSVFPSKSKQECLDIFRNSLWSCCHGFFEYFSVFQRPLEDWHEHTHIQNESSLRQALSSRRPIVFVSCHMSHFFYGFLQLCLTDMALPKLAVLKLFNQPKYEKKLFQMVAPYEIDIQSFSVESKNVFKVLRFLKQGHSVLTFLDIPKGFVKTENVSLFGRTTAIPSGPADLAILTNALIVPLTYYSTGISYVLQVEDTIDPNSYDPSLSKSEKSYQITQQLSDHFESWVRANPEQWYFWGILESLWKH